ncbi:hypothetical protein D3C76_1104240 [compost metagenome]
MREQRANGAAQRLRFRVTARRRNPFDHRRWNVVVAVEPGYFLDQINVTRNVAAARGHADLDDVLGTGALKAQTSQNGLGLQ